MYSTFSEDVTMIYSTSTH